MSSIRTALLSLSSSLGQANLKEAQEMNRRMQAADAKAWKTTSRFLTLLCVLSNADAHLCEVGWEMMQCRHARLWKDDQDIEFPFVMEGVVEALAQGAQQETDDDFLKAPTKKADLALWTEAWLCFLEYQLARRMHTYHAFVFEYCASSTDHRITRFSLRVSLTWGNLTWRRLVLNIVWSTAVSM